MSKLCAIHFIDASIDILIQLKTTAALISAVSERQVFLYGEFHDNTILESVLQTNGAKAVWVHDFSSDFITGIASCLDYIFKKAREPGFKLVQHGVPVQFLKRGVCSKRRLAICLSTTQSDMYPSMIHSKISCEKIVLYLLHLDKPRTYFEVDRAIVALDGWLRPCIEEGFTSISEVFGCKIKTLDNTIWSNDPHFNHFFENDSIRQDINVWLPSKSTEKRKREEYILKSISETYQAVPFDELVKMETHGLKHGFVFVLVSDAFHYPMIGATKREDVQCLFEELSRFISSPLKPIYTVKSFRPFQLEAEIHRHFEAFRVSEGGMLTEFLDIDARRVGQYLAAKYQGK